MTPGTGDGDRLHHLSRDADIRAGSRQRVERTAFLRRHKVPFRATDADFDRLHRPADGLDPADDPQNLVEHTPLTSPACMSSSLGAMSTARDASLRKHASKFVHLRRVLTTLAGPGDA